METTGKLESVFKPFPTFIKMCLKARKDAFCNTQPLLPAHNGINYGEKMQRIGVKKNTFWRFANVSLGYFCLILTGFGLPLYGQKKFNFDTVLSQKEINAFLERSIQQRDSASQAFAWYCWGKSSVTNQILPDSAFQYLNKSSGLFWNIGDSLSYHRVRAEQAIWLLDRGFDDEALQILETCRNFFHRRQLLREETTILAQLYRVEPTYKSKLPPFFKKADDYLAEFEQKNAQLKDATLDLIVLIKKADRLQKSRLYQQAEETGHIALELAKSKQLPLYIAHANYCIGLAALTDREYPKAEIYLKEAENTPFHLLPDELRRNIYRSLSELYRATGKLEDGISYSIHYGALSDTLLNAKRASALQNVTIQFDNKEKIKTIENLEREKLEAEKRAQLQKTTNIALLLGILGGIIAAITLFREYRHRMYAARIIAEQNETLNQKQIRELENSLRIETMQSMIAGQESERERVAKDLHDSVGGLLAAVKISIQGLGDKFKALSKSQQFVNVNNLLDETVTETRNIAHNLQPSALFRFGLVKAVQDLCSRFNAKGTPEISFQAIGDFSGLEDQKALNCYRIVQELLQNSVKHAEAREIMVQITRNESEITLLVEDNGKGYNPSQVNKGMGTDNLSYRVKFLNGELSVHSEPGKGTSNLVSIPC